MTKRIEIGLLAGLAIILALNASFALRRARKNSLRTHVVAMAYTVELGLRNHYDKHGRYPKKLSELGAEFFPEKGTPDDLVLAYDYETSDDSYVLRVKLPSNDGIMEIAGRGGKPVKRHRMGNRLAGD